MKLYSWCTPDFEILRDSFVATLCDDYQVICPVITMPEPSDPTSAGGGHHYNAKKTELLIAAIEENLGDPILFTDIDLQFFRPTAEIVASMLGANDIVFQREFFEGKERLHNINLGFTALHCNERTLAFHRAVLNAVERGNWDQRIVNEMLYEGDADLTWDLFPPDIWTLHCHYLHADTVVLHHPVVSDFDEKLKNMIEVRHEVFPDDDVLQRILDEHGIDVAGAQSHPRTLITDRRS